MRPDIYKFWKNHSLANIKPNVGGEFPEGWDVVEFFRDLYTVKEYGTVIDMGCGYGRLAEAFKPSKYKGMDISPSAISEAKRLNPDYRFVLIDEPGCSHSDTKLLYTVLLHQSDEDIERAIENLCRTTNRIIVAEICGRDWRREGNPPVFNRGVEEYQGIFCTHGKNSMTLIRKPYKRYKNFDKEDTDLSVMIFE